MKHYVIPEGLWERLLEAHVHACGYETLKGGSQIAKYEDGPLAAELRALKPVEAEGCGDVIERLQHLHGAPIPESLGEECLAAILSLQAQVRSLAKKASEPLDVEETMWRLASAVNLLSLNLPKCAGDCAEPGSCITEHCLTCIATYAQAECGRVADALTSQTLRLKEMEEEARKWRMMYGYSIMSKERKDAFWRAITEPDIESMTEEEVTAELHAAGITDDDISEMHRRVDDIIAKAKAKSLAAQDKEGGEEKAE